jgi:hypothetical protein
MMRCAAPAPGTGRRALFVSLSTKKEARVYGSSGRELALLEPNSLANHDLAVSADGRFVAVASFTAEVGAGTCRPCSTDMPTMCQTQSMIKHPGAALAC